MNVVVFVGPSLPKARAEAEGEVVVLPPAAVGDIYNAARRGARAIGLIDGYFEGVPSVWHKEILWALREGVEVFGGSSMGALRAAELHAFGMRGVGQIFEWFRDGLLEDDDEVAVLHGPAETGYLMLSEPMVNFRATLERASKENLIGSDTREALLSVAKRVFYQERTWDAVLAHPDVEAVPGDERERLSAWLPEGRIDIKKSDALSVLSAVKTAAGQLGVRTGASTDFHFEWTTMWDKVVAFSSQGAGRADASMTAEESAVLEELRLDAKGYERARDLAVLRKLVDREALREGMEVDHASKVAAMQRFRETNSLFRRAELDRWLSEHEMGVEGFEDLMVQEALLDWMRTAFAAELDDWLLAEARINGSYASLSGRAGDKQRFLARGDSPGVDSNANSPLQLRAWYFETRLDREMPSDMESFARSLGFADLRAFDRALEKEYYYVKGGSGQAKAGKSPA